MRDATVVPLTAAGGLVATAPLQVVLGPESVGVAGMLVILLALAWIHLETFAQVDAGEEDEAQRTVARLVSGGGIASRETPPVGGGPAQMGGGGFEPP